MGGAEPRAPSKSGRTRCISALVPDELARQGRRLIYRDRRDDDKADVPEQVAKSGLDEGITPQTMQVTMVGTKTRLRRSRGQPSVNGRMTICRSETSG